LPGRQEGGGWPAGVNPKQQLDRDLLQMKTLLETLKAAHDAARGNWASRPGSVTRTAASRDAGTNDLLLDDVLRTNENELQERR
jgi:hypothetical protein